jgi:diguanylate cyclase (GGDEF)-like protein
VAENAEYLALLGAYRQCLAFLEVQDIDRLGDLVLDTLMELLRAEGAVLWLQEHGGRQFRLRCRRGLARVTPAEEVFRPGDELRRQLLAGEPVPAAEAGGVWVPLQAGVEPLALARVESPVGRSAFGREDLLVAATVARFAASHLRNVLQLRRLQRSALRVPLGEAYTMAFYRDHADKELLKARRYGRNLSVVRLRIDNYAELNVRFRGLELETALGRLAQTVHSALRDADIMAQEAPHELHLLLPETDHWGSLVAQKRIRRALHGQLAICDLKKSYPIRLSLRSASFPGDGGSVEELERVVEGRLERLQNSLLQRGRLEGLPFWGVVGELLGGAGDFRLEGGNLHVSERLAQFEEPRRSRYWRMPAGQLDEVLRAFCAEVIETGRVRGLLYRGCDDFDAVRDSLRGLEGLERSATTLYLLGGRRRTSWEFQRILPIHIDDGNFAKAPFLLYLNDDCAYALFVRRAGRQLIGFHTSDFYFVENMIARLQEQYQLQAQL